jgi:hypothetical protein
MKIGEKGILFLLAFVCLILPVTPAFASNDFVQVNLAHDIPFVYNAMGYRVDLMANQKPDSNPSVFTPAWLGLYLDNRPPTEDFYGEFSQIGIKTDANGVYWFVYAEPGVTCLQGEYDYWNQIRQRYFGCRGYFDQYVSLGTKITVSLETSSTSGYWLATLWETVNGQTSPHPVALINNNSKRIYEAFATMEEGIPNVLDPYDPYLMADFYISHPQYYNPATDTYNEWPVSQPPGPNSNYSFLYTISNYPGRVICPIYLLWSNIKLQFRSKILASRNIWIYL